MLHSESRHSCFFVWCRFSWNLSTQIWKSEWMEFGFGRTSII